MLIACNGMQRSGSTLQYNLVCSLFEQSQKGQGEGWRSAQALKDEQAQLQKWAQSERYHIIKSHALVPGTPKLLAQKQLIICYTYRDIRDVAVSARRKFKHDWERLLSLLDRATARYFKMKELEHVIWQKYENMIESLEQETQKLSDALKLDISDNEVQAIANQWELNNTRSLIQSFDIQSGFDPKNLLHPDHITSEGETIGIWQSNLSSEEILILENRYEKYLDDAGYQASSATNDIS
jgi:hypothetical protein